MGILPVRGWNRFAARMVVAVLALTYILCSSVQAQNPVDLPTTNRSVTIAAANTFQQLLAATPDPRDFVRQSLPIQNNNTNTDNCWIAFGSVAGVAITAGNTTKGESILLSPGGSFSRYTPYIPSDAIIGTCAGMGDTLYIDTQ
jgi:hypothetical protein